MDTDGQLNPSTIKQILVGAEDLRIARELSEISNKVLNERLRQKREDQIKNVHLNLATGQQCIRDFFICLNENMIEWPDVYAEFSFNLRNSTTCPSCNTCNEYVTNQSYIELPVPEDDSRLKDHVEDFLNEGSKVDVFCSDGCNKKLQKTKKNQIVDCDEAKFLVIILSRGQHTASGYQFSRNRVKATDELCIRYIFFFNKL